MSEANQSSSDLNLNLEPTMATEEPSLNPDVFYYMAPMIPLRVGCHVSRELRVWRLQQTLRAKLRNRGLGAIRLRLDILELQGHGDQQIERSLGGWTLVLADTTLRARRSGASPTPQLVLLPVPECRHPEEHAECGIFDHDDDFDPLMWRRPAFQAAPSEAPWLVALNPEPDTGPLEDDGHMDLPSTALPGAPTLATVSPLATFDGPDAEAVIPLLPILDPRTTAIWERDFFVRISVHEEQGSGAEGWTRIGSMETPWSAFKDGIAFEARVEGSAPGDPQILVGFDERPERPGHAPGMQATAQESAAYFLTLLSFMDTVKRDGHRLRLRSVRLPEDLLLDCIRKGWKLDQSLRPKVLEMTTDGLAQSDNNRFEIFQMEEALFPDLADEPVDEVAPEEWQPENGNEMMDAVMEAIGNFQLD